MWFFLRVKINAFISFATIFLLDCKLTKTTRETCSFDIIITLSWFMRLIKKNNRRDSYDNSIELHYFKASDWTNCITFFRYGTGVYRVDRNFRSCALMAQFSIKEYEFVIGFTMYVYFFIYLFQICALF